MKKSLVIILAVAFSLILISCSVKNGVDSTTATAASETVAETIDNLDNEKNTNSVVYLKASLIINDDELKKGKCLVNLDFADASYKDVLGISNDDLQKEKNLFGMSGIKYEDFKIVVQEKTTEPHSFVQSVTLDSDIDLNNPFDIGLRLFYDGISYNYLSRIFKTQLNKEELQPIDYHYYYYVGSVYNWELELRYGLVKKNIPLVIIFADSIEEAKRTEVSRSDCSVVIFISEIVDNRTK